MYWTFKYGACIILHRSIDHVYACIFKYSAKEIHRGLDSILDRLWISNFKKQQIIMSYDQQKWNLTF